MIEIGASEESAFSVFRVASLCLGAMAGSFSSVAIYRILFSINAENNYRIAKESKGFFAKIRGRVKQIGFRDVSHEQISYEETTVHGLSDQDKSLIQVEKLTISTPARSFCFSCKKTIPWYCNIPLLSYLFLRGKCHFCSTQIGFKYLFNELVLASLFFATTFTWVGVAWLKGELLAILITWLALLAMWIAAVVDWNSFILPDGITKGGVVFGLIVAIVCPEFQMLYEGLGWSLSIFSLLEHDLLSLRAQALISGILSSSISFGLLLGIGKGFSYLYREEALGFGDVKYLAAVGALLGTHGAFLTLAVGVLLGALLGILNVVRFVLLIYCRRKRRGIKSAYVHSSLYVGWRIGRILPFGPPLILGTALALLFPSDIHNFFFVTWPNLLA